MRQESDYPLTSFTMQHKNKSNLPDFTDIPNPAPVGRILSLDLGTKKVGIALCDELQITVRRIGIVQRTGWKRFRRTIINHIDDFDAKALVIGLPINSDGSESEMSADARKIALKFYLSIDQPVFLQDERVSTYDARGNLWRQGYNEKQMRETLDAEAAAIILDDFLDRLRTSK